MRKNVAHILFFLSAVILLAAGACRRLPDGGDGQGDLVLCLSADGTGTKADDSSPDGDKYHNVLVVIADNNGKVVDKVFKSYPCLTPGPNQDAVDASSVENDRIYFRGLRVGYYQVYAYANLDATAWQQADISSLATIEEVVTKLTADGAAAHLDSDRKMLSLSETETPPYPGTSDTTPWMLLTGHDELYVGVDENIGTVVLSRPVVQFNVVVDNHTPFPIRVTDLHFNDFNASSSYLFARTDASGNPVVPDNNYRPLPSLESPFPIGSQEQQTIYSVLLYENRLGQDYRMFATVEFAEADGSIVSDGGTPLVDPNDITKPLSKKLISSSVRRVPYEEIRDLNREMNVMAITPNTTNGVILGYFYSSQQAKFLYEPATYNFEESFRSKATSLLNNQEIGNYYQLKLSKDSDGRYHLMKGSYEFFSGFSGFTGNGLFLKEGTVTANYPISQEFTGSLCRFTETNANNARSLYFLDGALSLASGSTNYGNRMWVFYETHPEGTVLKLIDRETSRVSTLTQMVRGQKLTAVMNIYYESASGEFTFSLDNVYWENGHNPKHTFK